MKTVNEVVAELQCLVKQDPSLGSVPVYVFADHGQTFIQSNCVSVEHTLEDYEYYAEVVDLEELDCDEMKAVNTFVCIGG